MSNLKRRVELLHRSSERMLKALSQPRDRAWWLFMRRESWVHFKRSLGLLLAVLRKRD